MALDIKEKETDGVTVLVLTGRVVLGEESSQLRTKLKDLLGQGKTRLGGQRHESGENPGASLALCGYVQRVCRSAGQPRRGY